MHLWIFIKFIHECFKMSTIIKFDLKELRKLTSDKNSCVIEKKVTQNLALQPWCLGNIKESIKNLLNYKIGKFDKEFNGILLSYKNLRILQNVGTIRNDNPDVHFQVQADYFIFRPHVGATLRGIVNKKSPTHLGILVHRVFNVVIPRPTEESGNTWIGSSIEEGQQVVFRIMVLDLYGALPYIRGEFDERWLKMGPDGDDDDDDEPNINQTINVSYINFDKTKPSQKQIGDGLPNTSPKSNKTHKTSITTGKSPIKNNEQSSDIHAHQDKHNSVMTKKVVNELSIAENEKTKKKSRKSELEKKLPEANEKQSKKHKRDS